MIGFAGGICPQCGQPLPAGQPRKFCSRACTAAAARGRWEESLAECDPLVPPEEVIRRRDAIRDGWSAAERARRQVYKPQPTGVPAVAGGALWWEGGEHAEDDHG